MKQQIQTWWTGLAAREQQLLSIAAFVRSPVSKRCGRLSHTWLSMC